VFDGVRVVLIGHFEKFLEMAFWLPRLALEIMLGGHDKLLVGVARFFVIVIAAGSDCDLPGASLLPLLAALSAFLSAFAAGFGWCCSTAAGDRLPVAKNKSSHDGLLSRGMPHGDIKQLLGGVR
jgi:hypothetical protein